VKKLSGGVNVVAVPASRAAKKVMNDISTVSSEREAENARFFDIEAE
jgi:hypothetical protein